MTNSDKSSSEEIDVVVFGQPRKVPKAPTTHNPTSPRPAREETPPTITDEQKDDFGSHGQAVKKTGTGFKRALKEDDSDGAIELNPEEDRKFAHSLPRIPDNLPPTPGDGERKVEVQPPTGERAGSDADDEAAGDKGKGKKRRKLGGKAVSFADP